MRNLGLIYIYCYIYKKQIKNKDLLYSTGNCIQYLLITHNGKVSEKRYVCLCVYQIQISESLCCPPETCESIICQFKKKDLQASLVLVAHVSNSCDPMNCNSPGSSVHGISQARILEWVATSFSRGSSLPRERTWVSCSAGRFFTI